MFRSNSHIPFYRQMIDLLQNALNLLDEQGKDEVFQFIVGQQKTDGGFKDRAGRSDLYYSLFGAMLLKSSPLNPPKGDFLNGSQELHQLKKYLTHQSNSKISGFIEQCCLVLLQKELKIGGFSRFKSIISLSRSFWKERHSINLSYRSFVLFLTLDAVFPFPGLLKSGAGKMLKRTIVDQHSPCSEVAAKVFLQKMLEEKCDTEVELLKSYADERGGFKAFHHVDQPDMLSTAVALFSLNFAGSDLRLLKPTCLDFIQENYSGGAFLSGDGDLTRDVEYTFYGLLALGVLAG